MMGNTIYPINSNNVRIESQIININYNIKKKKSEFSPNRSYFNLHNTGKATQLEIDFQIQNLENLKDFKVLSFPDSTPFDITLEFKEAIILSVIEDSSFFLLFMDCRF